MANVDPFIIPAPQKWVTDPEVGPFINYLVKFCHDLWQRSGAGSDLIDNAQDHGNLAGLTDDDHSQYLNETRHDALAADNPHSVTFTQAVTADAGTDISAVEAETLTDGSNADSLHAHFGNLGQVVTVTSSPYTALVGGPNIILVDDDTVGGAAVVDLPAASGATDEHFIVKKLGTTGTVTVDGNASETIDGATTQVLSTQYDSLIIVCDGSAWWIL